jgi:RecA-family ATPase
VTATNHAQLLFDGIVAALKKRGAPINVEWSGDVLSECPRHSAPVPLRVEMQQGLGLNDDKVIIRCLARTGCTPKRILKELDIDPSAPPPGAPTSANGQAPTTRTLKATKASDIEMTATRWLWEEDEHCWIPQGHLVGFGGREGVGKSTWCAHLAAKVTRGVLRGDSYGKPRGVIIVSTEDDWSATITPRLSAAGADLDRVFHVTAVEPDGLEGVLSLPGDLPELEKIIRDHDVALVILDPLLTLISSKLDTHRDAEVRQALGPMTRLAHDTGVSLLGLVHVNKSSEGDLLNRIMASRAIVGVPRAFLFCAKYDKGEEEQPDSAAVLSGGAEFVFGQIKSNLAAKVGISLRYRMATVAVGWDEEKLKAIKASQLDVDAQPVNQNVEDIVLEQEKARKSQRTQGGKAEKWLVNFLAGKGEVGTKTIIKAGKEAGFSRATLFRVRKELEELDRLETVNLPTVPKSSTWKLLDEEEGS